MGPRHKRNENIFNKDEQVYKPKKEHNRSNIAGETTPSEKLRYKHADKIYD